MRLVVTILCGVVLLGVAGCATTGGAEVAGPASQVKPPPTAPPLPSGTPPSADAIGVLRADPAVPAEVKATLVLCDGGFYPVDERYADLTLDGRPELVVTVFPCKVTKEPAAWFGGGVAGYVYDLTGERPTRLLSLEDGGVELLLNTEHRLIAVRSTYESRDDPCCPTGQRFSFYAWNGTELVEVKR